MNKTRIIWAGLAIIFVLLVSVNIMLYKNMQKLHYNIVSLSSSTYEAFEVAEQKFKEVGISQGELKKNCANT